MEQPEEFGVSRKIKIAWICIYTDEYVQSRLPLWNRSNPIASWISNSLEGFKNSDELEIHIISEHKLLKRAYSFYEGNIFYHYYPTGIPFIHRSWPQFFRFDVLTSFFVNRLKIRSIIKRIKPDIVHLHGAENAQYSSSFFDLHRKYPLVVTIQGFIHLDVYSKDNYVKKNRINVEKKIVQECKYFFLDNDSVTVIKEMRTEDFIYYSLYYPVSSLLENYVVQCEKEVDLLFWGRICKDKGAEDFINLISKLKLNYGKIKACFIGGVSKAYKDHLISIAQDLNCNENISFKGFILNTEELFNEVAKCKVLVIPTYNDRFPAVLREAVFLRLGIVAYKTGSIPEFNKEEERILLVEQGDLKQLVDATHKLLNNDRLLKTYVTKAYEHGKAEFGIKSNCTKMAVAYKTILANNSIN